MIMLREILGVRQDEPHTERRWFHDDYFDLFVWQSCTGEVCAFQLCYGLGSSERALVWDLKNGYFHDGINDNATGTGEVLGGLRPPGTPDGTDPIASRFDVSSRALPDSIRAVVGQHIRQYALDNTPTSSRRSRFRRAPWQQEQETS
jgi:hypothetical protein